jgi:hypothetical protein
MIELIQIERVDDRLVIDYQVRNPEPSGLFLFDLFWEVAEDGFTVLQGECYRRARDGRLVLERLVQPSPPGVLLERPETPYASFVPMGGVARRRIDLPVPVMAYNAYTGVQTEGEPGLVQDIVLSLGHVAGHEIPKDWAVVRAVPTLGEGIYRPDYGLAIEMQKISQVSLPVPEGLTALF